MHKIIHHAKTENELFDLPMKIPGKKIIIIHFYSEKNEKIAQILIFIIIIL